MSGLARASLTEELTGQVLDLIREQGLTGGDRLPTARALADRFGVATPTIREALRQLQATGVVEIRHGSGVYVREGHDRIVLRNPNVRALEGERLLQLLDARLLIEPHLAELAARSADERGSAELRGAIEGAERYLAGDDEALHETNMGFHRAVAIASGNTVLAAVMDSLVELHGPDQREILRLFDDRKRDHAEHVAICTAIIHGHPTKARRLMHDHLAHVRDVVAARIEGREGA